jgi:hypothetical protein
MVNKGFDQIKLQLLAQKNKKVEIEGKYNLSHKFIWG